MKTILILLMLLSSLLFKPKEQVVITKEEVKALKKQLPDGLIVEADYLEHEIWVKTPEIYANGVVHALSTYTPELTHQFYFKVTKNENGEYVRNGLHYIIKYNAPNWLFINKMMIRTAKTNKETRQGLGAEYNVTFPQQTEEREVAPLVPISGGGLYVVKPATIFEKYDIYNDSSIVSWLKDVAATGNFTRLRIYGDKGYTDQVVFSKTLQPQALAITKAMEFSSFTVNE